MAKRLNIGFMVDDLNNYFTSQACKGAELAAKHLDANLIVFPGRYLGEPDGKFGSKEYEYQYNSVFSLASSQNIDILYVLLGTICSRASEKIQQEFLESLPDVPIVHLFAKVDGYQSVTFDNKSGFKNVVRHLIEGHHVKNIGYVSGPKTNQDALERLDACREAVAEFGLELSDKQIVYGDFTDESEDVVRELMKKNSKLDAIVFANDSMAVGGYKVIYEMGLVPGKDILVTGFDDDAVSIAMVPPLTTVEASSADLTYKAFINAPNYIKGTELTNMEVETYLVQRSSCGCEGLNYVEMYSRLHLESIFNGNNKFIDSIEKYLFGIFEEDAAVGKIKQKINAFLQAYASVLTGGSSSWDDVNNSFGSIVSPLLFSYTVPEKFYNVLAILQKTAVDAVNDLDSINSIHEIFTGFYRQLSFRAISIDSDDRSRSDKLNRLVNQRSEDVFLVSNDNEVSYEHLIDGLPNIGFKQTLMYLFQGNVHNSADVKWKRPNSILLKAVANRKGAIAPVEEQQLVRTVGIFDNEFVDNEDRATLVAFPLFVGDDLYGMLVVDSDCRSFADISPVANQLSITLKSLLLIEGQKKAKKTLQNSLEQFMRDNSLLDAISKSDELTGLYNRRGFLDHSQKAITDLQNKGKKTLVCYADMDNLKMVNDKFGHDEGDFALREIAAVLKETFRSTDIIGRLGGDEFVVFAIVGVENCEAVIKKRITEILKRHNENVSKPYPIDMSTGIYEFECSPDIDIYSVLDLADEKLYNEKTEKKARNGSYR
ncbi:MAG: GGDEF domain-containing protein [Saccharofermentans sp.]|nr:GGDEF domain-containing protein [Saccharofermentans sp.]